MPDTTLVINASAKKEESVSRDLVDLLLAQLDRNNQLGTVIERDLATNDMALITEDHVEAYYTPPESRTVIQKNLLQQSDGLIAELKQSKQLIIGTPMYNFSVPAVLKAWIDLVCRVGETFRYTENGPEGLTKIDRAYFVVATGGTPADSPIDFLVPYLRQIAKFIGVKKVEVITADGLASNRERVIEGAKAQIAMLV